MHEEGYSVGVGAQKYFTVYEYRLTILCRVLCGWSLLNQDLNKGGITLKSVINFVEAFPFRVMGKLGIKGENISGNGKKRS